MTARGLVAVVLPASVVTVRVATDAVKRAERRAVVLLASSHPSSVVDSVVALVVAVLAVSLLLPLRRGRVSCTSSQLYRKEWRLVQDGAKNQLPGRYANDREATTMVAGHV